MDEYLLNDLLECSVCLDRLDTSSKVLPCQHTFCKKCLQEIVSTKKELRCPECRVLVTTAIDGLPPNVLLMRILEGMRHAGNALPKKRVVPVVRPTPTATVLPTCATVLPTSAQPAPTAAEVPSPKPQMAPKQLQGLGKPMARALYDYQSLEPEDLCFKKGEVITLRSKIDAHWAQGECSGRIGIFPLTFVQIITPLPPQVATCRALYDFRMNNDEVEGCLSFRKDELLAVLRRVDENWVEGRLRDRIGIFPLAFVELNPTAKALMKLSSNEQPGPSRLAPPTPTSDDSTPLIPTDSKTSAPEHNRLILSPPPAPIENNRPCPGPMTAANRPSPGPMTATNRPSPGSLSAANRPAPVAVAETRPAKPSTACGSIMNPRPPASESNSSTSTTTPNTSSSSSSSSASTAPSSPASPQQQPAPPPTAPLNPFMRPQTMLLPTSHITTQPRDKRNSFPALPSQPPPPPTNRHSAEIVSLNDSCSTVESSGAQTGSAQMPRDTASGLAASGGPTSGQGSGGQSGSELSNARGTLVRHGSQRHVRSASDLGLVHLPAAYVALYPYKPQKADELELKKGGVYLVTERCQDGWFKGTSNRTQKCGVFPGNYVTLAKPTQSSHSRVVSSSPRESSTPPPMLVKPRSGPALRQAVQCSLAPPELPPRAASPALRAHRQPWNYPIPLPSEPETAAVELPTGPPPAVPAKVEHAPRHAQNVSNTVSPPPNVSVSLSPISPKTADKAKEKKEKSGLMKRLAAIKRSKSPTVPAYSMDNPVFEDSSVPVVSVPHAAHSRSGSCPSQLMQLPSAQVPRNMSTSLSARGTRHKERPSVAAAQFTPAPSRGGDSASPGPAPQASSHPTASHRKSSSLDAGDPRNVKHLVPAVRERFRCIVPYPPNSDYELELRVGDIIYVHRKRDDGWYKGTQQRTGRTGLFPASFVDTY